jgi:hypothetical protein
MKTVIEMALEAGLIDFRDPLSAEYTKAVIEDLTAFAALVRADERSSWPAEMEAMERQVNILTDALAQAKADAWEEGYKQGVDDERTSEASIGIAGGNFKVNPARENPYRARSNS